MKKFALGGGILALALVAIILFMNGGSKELDNAEINQKVESLDPVEKSSEDSSSIKVEVATGSQNKTDQFKDLSVSLSGDVLKIEGVEIKKGEIPELSGIFKEGTYTNSNVENYMFMILDNELEVAKESLDSKLKTAGYKRKEDTMIYEKGDSKLDVFISETVPETLRLLREEGTFVEVYFSKVEATKEEKESVDSN